MKVIREAKQLRVLFALFALVDKSAKIKRLCGVSLIFSYYNLHILLLYIFSAQISKPALSKYVYRQTPIFRHPFLRKQCFSLKSVLVAPPQNFWRDV